jgi:hypothetical protein
MMKTLTLTRNKSFEWSFGLHAGFLLIAFLPFAHQVMEKKPMEYILEVGYQEVPESMASGSEGLQARSPVFNEEPEPTSDQPAEEPIPVEDTEPVEETTIADNDAEVISDVTAETESDITASETTADGADAETHGDGGGNGSPIEGNQDGAAMEGDGGGGDGLEGDGIITRKVIYREDISSVAKVSGRVVLDICIDREGKVIYAAYDPEKTTITDTEIIKQAYYLAVRYRFEAKYNAPKKEWGELTFIFSINEDVVSK